MKQPLLPADVQLRADAELGSAWRRCEAALPEDESVELVRTVGIDPGQYLAGTTAGEYWRAYFYADTPVDALNALAERLEAL